MLQNNPDKISGINLSANPSTWAVEMLQNHPELIHWSELSENPCPAVLPILEGNPDRIDWVRVSRNTSAWAIQLLEEELRKHPDNHRIHWAYVCMNPFARRLLESQENYPKNLHLGCLAINPCTWAIDLVEEAWQRNPDDNHIQWNILADNPHPSAMNLLEKEWKRSPRKFQWCCMSFARNPNIFIYDYEQMKYTKNRLHEDLIQTLFHPKNMERFEGWGFECGV
jgi:hypothetical protein